MRNLLPLVFLSFALLLAGCSPDNTEPSTPEEMYAKAQELLKPSAERDEPDVEGALRWLNQAAEAGHLQAQLDLGGIYYGGGKEYTGGKGIPVDGRMALKWFTRASEQGDAHALVFMGKIYCYAMGVEQNIPKCIQCWRKAVEAGVDEAHYFLGYVLVQNSPDTVMEGVEHLKKAATQVQSGIAAQAATMLGSLYFNGHGPLAQDKAAAVEWYRRAAEAGSPHSQRVYGLMLLDGGYVPLNVGQGLAILRLSAGQDYLPAMADLIEYLQNAEGSTPEMKEEAEVWRKRYAELQSAKDGSK